MGGFGSGRPCGSGRAKVEGCRSLDVNRLPREGCVRSGIGLATGIGPAMGSDRVNLAYRVRVGKTCICKSLAFNQCWNLRMGECPDRPCNPQSEVSALRVRRDKAALSSGCKPHPATAPAGSNRSSHGGDKMAEAFGVAGHV